MTGVGTRGRSKLESVDASFKRLQVPQDGMQAHLQQLLSTAAAQPNFRELLLRCRVGQHPGALSEKSTRNASRVMEPFRACAWLQSLRRRTPLRSVEE